MLWKPKESMPSPDVSPTSRLVPPSCGGIFDFEAKRERLEELNHELGDPAIWNTPDKAQSLGRERARLESTITELEQLGTGLADAAELLAIVEAEDDAAGFSEIVKEMFRNNGATPKVFDIC